MTKISGSCLCGSVKYEGDIDPVFAANCHCVDCRKVSGSGHLALIAAPEAGISFTGDVKSYELTADSGSAVAHHFCPNCGSQMYNTNSRLPGVKVLVATTLDDPEFYKPGMTVYASRALSWDQPDPSTQQFETMPPGNG